MRATKTLLALAAVAAGCGAKVEVRPEDPMTTEVRTDYLAVEALDPEPEPPRPHPAAVAANYLYQGAIRYPVAWIPTVVANLPVVLVGEVFVAALIPAATTWGWLEPQDLVDDAVYHVYQKGVNIEKMWALTPQWLDDRYDLVRNNRREGLPPDASIPADRYPPVQILVPPKWDEPPRSWPKAPEPEEGAPGPEEQPR